MPVEECPHCLQRVVFSENGICPSCGKNKYVSPGKSREKILYEQEKENLTEQLTFAKKKSIGFLIGGLLIFSISLFISIWTSIYSNVVVWIYGGVIAGAIMIYNGYRLKKHQISLKRILTEKYNK